MKITKLVMFFIFAIITFSIQANADEYTYRDSNTLYATLNNQGDRLYVSLSNGEIIEINSQTMEEVRSFSLLGPFFLSVSPTDDYLYTDVNDQSILPNSEFTRIDLNTENISTATLNGDLVHFTINEQGTKAWAVHRTYPAPGMFPDVKEAINDYPHSGFVSKINLSTMTIENTSETLCTLPMSVFYSEYSDNVYIAHEVNVSLDGLGRDEISLTVFSGDLIPATILTACHHEFSYWPTLMTKWSDDSRYFVIGNSNTIQVPASLKIIDTNTNNLVASPAFYDIQMSNSSIMNTVSFKKIKNQNYVWALSDYTRGDDTTSDNYRVAIKIDANTMEFQIFELAEITDDIVYFDISYDGRTLYIPVPEQNSIVVVSPDNHIPVCKLEIITQMPYQGPSPAAIEFDASGTFDLDGDELTFHWDFDGDKIFDEPVDDAYTGDPDNPTHEYTEDYAGPVFLKVTDNYQGECEATVTIIVDIT